ncbi:MAG: formate dehydrogenase [Burkholderiaceae bacterium]
MKFVTTIQALPAVGDQPLKRRGLLWGAGAAGAAVVAAKVLPGAGAAAASVPMARAATEASAGYQLTPHVRRYYETARG